MECRFETPLVRPAPQFTAPHCPIRPTSRCSHQKGKGEAQASPFPRPDLGRLGHLSPFALSPNLKRHIRSQQTPPAGHGSPVHPNEYLNNSLAAPNPSTSLRYIAKPDSVGWRTSPPPLHDLGDRLHYRDPSAVPRWGGSAHSTARRGALGAQNSNTGSPSAGADRGSPCAFAVLGIDQRHCRDPALFLGAGRPDWGLICLPGRN